MVKKLCEHHKRKLDEDMAVVLAETREEVARLQKALDAEVNAGVAQIKVSARKRK
jgi:hypothetical protein